MAQEDLDLDVESTEEPVKKSGSKMLIIAGVAGVLLLGASTYAALFFAGVIGGKEEVAAVEETEGKDTSGTNDTGDKKSKDTKGGASATGPLIYESLDPPFVLNFGMDSDYRLLQISVQITTRDPKVVTLVKEHAPAIRNMMVLLFSEQDPLSLNSREGKEVLRQKVLEGVRAVMEEQTGITGIENVYFTNFVMQ